MQKLSAEGHRHVDALAEQYGVSGDAARTLLQALAAGGGSMAQFSHPDLGGMGQWTQGGMTMVGDMFNSQLKARVDGLCTELSKFLREQGQPETSRSDQSRRRGDDTGEREPSLFIPEPPAGADNWWGAELGQASSKGAQNDMRYAYFPATRRLAIDVAGKVDLFDTGAHQITGVAQQQSGSSTLTFTSQHGLVRISELRPLPSRPSASRVEREEAECAESATHGDAHYAEPSKEPAPATQSSDPLAMLERLADLRDKQIISEDEFTSKKADLLRRL